MMVFVTPIRDATIHMDQALVRQSYVASLRGQRDNNKALTNKKRKREQPHDNESIVSLSKDA